MILHEDCGACPGLEGLLGETYTFPHLDPAPWFDARHPESADFAGLLVRSVEMDSPVRRRPFAQNVGHGATLGRLRLSGRRVLVTGWLMGRTCCAVQYGLSWLTSALLSSCASGCGGTQACFLGCCPSIAPVDCLTDCDDDGHEIPFDGRAGELTEYQRGEDFWRRWIGVGLLEAPVVTDRFGGSCGSCNCSEVSEIEFVLGVSQPWTYGEAVAVIENEPPGVCQEIIPRTDCAPFPDCADDPCPTRPTPPAIPPIVNPCIELTQPVSRICGEILGDDLSDWFDATLVIEVRAGSQELRNLALRVWRNPAGFECGNPEFLEECSACSTLYVQYVPPEGILRIDGVQRRITIECANNVRDATGNVFTLEGQPFEFIDVDCIDVCACADFACSSTAPDASLSVFVVPRELG